MSEFLFSFRSKELETDDKTYLGPNITTCGLRVLQSKGYCLGHPDQNKWFLYQFLKIIPSFQDEHFHLKFECLDERYTRYPQSLHFSSGLPTTFRPDHGLKDNRIEKVI